MKIPWAKPCFTDKEQEYLSQALESSWISGGKYVDQFEERFSKLNQAPHFITTSNGTTALHLALLGAGVKLGDEVIVPAFTFVAPGNMVMAVGATPVYADVDPDTWCIDPQDVKAKITSKTKAVIAVHIYGNLASLAELRKICDEKKIILIEDNAEAALSKYQGKYSGTWGHIGCFSFHATKTITMGEGGGVLTADDALHTQMRLIRDHGMNKSKRYWHETLGFNFRLTNLQAAIGCAQLEKVDRMIERRKVAYAIYKKLLGSVDGIKFQKIDKNVDPVIWTVGMEIDSSRFKGDRDWMIETLMKAGVETRPGFYPFSKMPFYKAPSRKVADQVSGKIMCVPFFEQITESEIDYVCKEILRLRK